MRVTGNPSTKQVTDAPVGSKLTVTTLRMEQTSSGCWTLGCKTFTSEQVLTAQEVKRVGGQLMVTAVLTKTDAGFWKADDVFHAFSTGEIAGYSRWIKLEEPEELTKSIRPGTWYFENCWYRLTPTGKIHRLNGDGTYERNMGKLPKGFKAKTGMYQSKDDRTVGGYPAQDYPIES